MVRDESRFERRDIVLATVTAILGGCATIVAAIGILVLSTSGR